MSESEDEDYASYGTPLEPIDEDNLARRKPIPVSEQTATDKHGRRRFHGAFTGGFSAGFFNTVGSLEGWRPATFKSSRTSRADSHLQKPQDFMDDEDRDEFGIAPSVLRAKPEYGGVKRTKKDTWDDHQGPIPGEPVLKNILEPVGETIGIQMLMKMGWKPGQGIGPRLSKLEKHKAKRKAQGRKKIYGASLPPGHSKTNQQDSSSDSDVENFDAEILFAPDEKKPYLVVPKEDTFGMGYKGLDKRPILSHISLFEPSSLKFQDNKNRVSIRGQAFGVGAFEEEDEDIYSKDDMSQYDFALESHSTLAAKRKEEKKNKTLAITNNYVSIEGFLAWKHPPLRNKHFPPPELPPDFKPNPRRSRFETDSSQVERNTGTLTSEGRAAIIAEASTSIKESVEKETKTEDGGKYKETSFKPFESDPNKQERYEKYLNFIRIGAKDLFSKIQPDSMTEWEREKERSEFEKAASLYTPLSGYMAERFTPGNSGEEAPQEAQSDRAAAAKAGMFGKLTREVSDWIPCSLICKRFNTPQPHSTDTMMNAANQKNKGRIKFSVFDFLEAAKQNSHSGLLAPHEIKSEPKEICAEKSVEDKQPVEISLEREIEDILMEPTNKADLFKAIFLSGSENEDDESESSKLENQKDNIVKGQNCPLVAFKQTDLSLVNVLRNTSPPRGIFANLDLDALGCKKNGKNNSEEEGRKSPDEGTVNIEEKVHDALIYGPQLPKIKPEPSKQMAKRANSSSSDSEESDSSDEWVEKTSPRETEKSKHKKHSSTRSSLHKKKKKSKHKHKRKKKYR